MITANPADTALHFPNLGAYFLSLNREAMAEGSNLGFCGFCSGCFEYETPKVITVQNVPLGILRIVLHTVGISFIVFYQLWYARGYQEFAVVETSLTVKIKGIST